MNYFEHRAVAERYARYRPYFHPLVIEKIKAYLNIQRPVNFALDVGCGPGQSTTALKEIAEFVIGADISAGMLAAASKNTGIQYIQSPAEELPIRDHSIDLLTTSLAFHWFDQGRFFAEARRVLKEKAWLVISNNGFTGRMAENLDFEQWMIQVYDRRYPSPPRNAVQMTPEVARRYGFQFAREDGYQNNVQFTVEELAAYLVTQSNVIAAIEKGNEKSMDDVYRWIITETRSLFKRERPAFVFSGYIWYLQKTS